MLLTVICSTIILAANLWNRGRNMIDELQDERVQEFWDAYAAAVRLGAQRFGVLRFGDCEDLADEIASQVVAGEKRATTSLVRDFTELGKPMPKPGNFCVVIDGKNSPRCIVHILQVDMKPLGEVDESFAWDEGGGDRSLEWWRSAHARYFKRQGAREGFAVDDATEVILERFEVVWPPELSDRP
jgi:uncharacterized protein YhfF